MMAWKCVIFLPLFGLDLIRAFPTGAPRSACVSMTPRHRSILAQTGPPPYAIRIGATSYQPNGTVRVTLYSKCDIEGFGGFLLQARRVDVDSTRDAPVGFFNVISRSTAVNSCGLPSTTGTTAQAVTHDDGNQLKSRMVFEWTAPSQPAGDIAMVATFAKIFSTFWVKVHSDILQDASSAKRANPGTDIYPTVTSCDQTTTIPPTTTTTTTTTPSTTTTTPTTTSPTTPTPTTTTPTAQLRSLATLPTPTTTSTATPEAATLPLTTTTTSTKTAYPQTVTVPKQAVITRPIENTTSPQIISAYSSRSATPSRSTHSKVTSTTKPTTEASTQPPSLAPEPPSQGTTGLVPDKIAAAIDVECGKSKGCYSLCDKDVCSFTVSWWNSSGAARQIQFEITSTLQSQVDQWVALGFSSDTEMGDDSVVECVSSSSGSIGVYTSYNLAHDNERIGTAGVSESRGSFENGILKCAFRRQYSVEGNNRIFDLGDDAKWHLLVASGTATNYVKKPHRYDKLPVVSRERRSLRSTRSVVEQSPAQMLIKAHGTLMLVAWVLTASLGMIVARYYKRLGGKDTCAGEKCWFQIHRVCMVLTSLCVLAGFILIFVHVRGYSQVGIPQNQASYLQAHPILGIIVTALVVINFVMALLRPAPGGKARLIYNWLHWGVGTSAWILAVITIFFGFAIEKAGVHWVTKYVMAAFVGYHLLVEIILEMISCRNGKNNSKKYEMMPMGEKNRAIIVAHTDTEHDSNEHSGVGFLKRGILLIHTLILTAFVIALSIFVNLSLSD